MYFVFDIETIPDFDFLEGVTEGSWENRDQLLEMAAEQLAKNKSGFLPPMYHKIVSWVGLWVDDACNPKAKHAWSGHDEKAGLEHLMSVLSEYKDFGVVHHNGKGFDLPLITYRCLKHGLQMTSRLGHYDIKYRFSKHNVDLVDEFSNFGASSWPKLKHLGLLIGIPFKQTGEGNQVLAMYDDGQLAEIEHYCYEDVLATYLIWLNLRHTLSDIRTESYQHLHTRAVQRLQQIQQGLPE